MNNMIDCQIHEHKTGNLLFSGNVPTRFVIGDDITLNYNKYKVYDLSFVIASNCFGNQVRMLVFVHKR